MYFRKVSGIRVEGWEGEREAELLRERSLESDSSEFDTQLSISTCATFDT